MKQVYNRVDTAVHTVEDIVAHTDRTFSTYRESVFKRFPIVFALLVAFGGATTFYGMERLISALPWLNDRPLLIVCVGLGTLALTGKLYKKLSD